MRALEQGRAFRTAAKGLVSIGAGLAQLKEFRDLFEDANQKVVEPLIEAVSLNATEVE